MTDHAVKCDKMIIKLSMRDFPYYMYQIQCISKPTFNFRLIGLEHQESHCAGALTSWYLTQFSGVQTGAFFLQTKKTKN